MDENEDKDPSCASCGNEYAEEDMTDLTGNGEEFYCEDCTRECNECGERNRPGDMAHIRTWSETVYWCEDCAPRCNECETVVHEDEARYINDDRYCTECSYYCDSCGDYYLDGDRCCEEQVDIEGYHHTSPSMWLGGPVRSEGGYYLGIENEIYSERMVGTPVLQWGEANVANGAFHCKEDSSVEGFEIVTEPMTPEFFEQVNWEGFFTMLNDEYPVRRNAEPEDHGLHVHIGRSAFDRDDAAIAAFCYIIGQGEHLERIGRRAPTGYCEKVRKPASSAIAMSRKQTRQRQRLNRDGYYGGRNAINLTNGSTIEIRAFRATRSAKELREAVRYVYVTAEYVRFLRAEGHSLSPKHLNRGEYLRWVAVNYPEAFASIANVEESQVVPTTKRAALPQTVNFVESSREERVARRNETGLRAGLRRVDMAVMRLEEEGSIQTALREGSDGLGELMDWERELLDEPLTPRRRTRSSVRPSFTEAFGNVAAAAQNFTATTEQFMTSSGWSITVPENVTLSGDIAPRNGSGMQFGPGGGYYAGCTCNSCQTGREGFTEPSIAEPTLSEGDDLF